jgi:hypothetical protein
LATTGVQGGVGATPNLSIGTVSNLSSNSTPFATITGTSLNPVLNLGLIQGQQGGQGPQGSSGSNGSDGAKGDKGDTGSAGGDAGLPVALAVQVQVVALELVVTALSATVAGIEANILALQTQLAVVEGEITAIQGDITALNNDVTVITNQTQNILATTTVGQTNMTGSLTMGGTMTSSVVDSTTINSTTLYTTNIDPTVGSLYIGGVGSIINIGDRTGFGAINLYGPVNMINGDVFNLGEFINQIG